MFLIEYEVGSGAYGVAIGADGAVWTTLVARGELARVSPDGDVSRFGMDAEQSRPMVLTRGPDDAVWFSRGDGRIGRIDAAGSMSSILVTGSPYGLCAGPDRTVWYTLLGEDRIGRIALDGGIEEFSLEPGGMPSMITTGPDGALWFTLNRANAIGRVTGDGDVTTYPLPTPEAAPVGMSAGRDAMWFAEIGAGQIGRISAGGRIDEFPLPDRSSRPHAVATTRDGGCWATLWATSSIVRLDGNGHVIDEVAFKPGAEPHGLAIAEDESLWVALETGSLVHVTR